MGRRWERGLLYVGPRDETSSAQLDVAMSITPKCASRTRQSLLMRALHTLNVGPKGTLVPLSVREFEGAIPQAPQATPLCLLPCSLPPGW